MDFLTDILGEPYQSIDLPLTADDEGDVVATLVRRRSADPGAAAGGSRRAVLYVHGFVDYGQGKERAVEEERVDRPLPGPPVGLGRLAATRKLPVPLNPHYVHSLHRDFRGSWEFDLALKPVEGFVAHRRSARRPAPYSPAREHTEKGPGGLGDDMGTTATPEKTPNRHMAGEMAGFMCPPDTFPAGLRINPARSGPTHAPMTSSFMCGYGMAADTGEGPTVQRTMVMTQRSSANARRHSKALFPATEVQVAGPAGAGGAGRPSDARAWSMLVGPEY
nr:hypothetical protein [Streptomyces antimycoticus]